MTEVSCLLQHLCSPREGYLNSFYKISRYQENNISKNPGRIAFDTYFVHTYEKVFKGNIIYLEY